MPPFSALELTAQTHPAAYSLHKYWARKPHNVVRRALEAGGVGPGGVVLDPFCGSGVPLSEAASLGAQCVGFDVNPVAAELTRVTLDPPPVDEYMHEVGSIVDGLERDHGQRYHLGGHPIRYTVHAIVTHCGHCGSASSANQVPKRGRTYVCPHCEHRLYFNLENLATTQELEVVLTNGERLPPPASSDQRAPFGEPTSQYDHPLTHNGRILAHRGMRTRHLFSERNFAVLSAFANRISALPPSLLPAARLTLTASTAQCSRLIAYRNGQTTGGPAWTVPGFWVPPIHLEANPIAHLRARVQRFSKGLRQLNELPNRGAHHRIHCGEAGRVLWEDHMIGCPNLVFLDPPYGDSVPYLEFSAMWNGFLGEHPDPGLDIAVSNRARGDGNWASYQQGLDRVLRATVEHMSADARVLVTFNNKDIRAWTALLASLQNSGLRCVGAFYQHPAVVSAKAQMAPKGSYVGDIYSLFERRTTQLRRVSARLERTIRRGASELDSLAQKRVLLLEALRENIDHEALPRLLELTEKSDQEPARSREPCSTLDSPFTAGSQDLPPNGTGLAQ